MSLCSINCPGVCSLYDLSWCPPVLSTVLVSVCSLYDLSWCPPVLSTVLVSVCSLYDLSWCPPVLSAVLVSLCSISCPDVRLFPISFMVSPLCSVLYVLMFLFFFYHLPWCTSCSLICPLFCIICSGVMSVLSIISPGVLRVSLLLLLFVCFVFYLS